MKKAFKSYYTPTEEEFDKLWNNCLFVLDANVLLNLYKYSNRASQDLIKILKEISARLWIPYQIAYEYHKNRLKVILVQKKIYDETINKLTDLKNGINSYFQTFGKQSYLNAEELTKKLFNEVEELIKNVNTRKQQHPNLEKQDIILDAITEIYDKKIGKKFQIDKISEIYKEGKRRYELLIPPGYLDKEKNENEKYGDLVLWFQIIDKAKEIKKPIIFVTDERKDDWWFKINDKTVGPRPELIEEMNEKGGVDFYIYQTDNFIKYMGKYLSKHVEQKTINEVKEIRKIDEDKLKMARESPLLKFRNGISPMAMSSAFTDMVGAYSNLDKIYPSHLINSLNEINSIAASSVLNSLTGAVKNINEIYPSHLINSLNAINSVAASSVINTINGALKSQEKLIGLNNYLESFTIGNVPKTILKNTTDPESSKKSNESNDDNQIDEKSIDKGD